MLGVDLPFLWEGAYSFVLLYAYLVHCPLKF